MNSTIKEASLVPERRPDESARAYQAFCIYRDLGPARSLDRAWERFCADHGKGRGSARRPGNWANWSQKYTWVKRAEAHDDLLEEENRIARAERRQKLRERGEKFETEDQPQLENLVSLIDAALQRMLVAPLAEVTQVSHDKVTGKTTTTKSKALDARGAADLTQARKAIVRQVILGVCDAEAPEREERKVERIVWFRNEQHEDEDALAPDSVRQLPGSGQPSRKKFKQNDQAGEPTAHQPKMDPADRDLIPQAVADSEENKPCSEADGEVWTIPLKRVA